MRRIKINLNEYPNVWITSDWHLGHDKEFLYAARGAETRDKYVRWMIEQINEIAGPEDLIIHMGDMCLTCTMDEYVGWLLEINCKNIWSLEGNHDHRFEVLMDKVRGRVTEELTDNMVKLKFEKNLRNLGPYVEGCFIEAMPNGQRAKKYGFTLTHFPMLIWNKSQHGTWNLCGHSHGNCLECSPFMTIAKRLDCGVDNALVWSEGQRVMFDFEDVRHIMKEKQVEILDHHNEKTT